MYHKKSFIYLIFFQRLERMKNLQITKASQKSLDDTESTNQNAETEPSMITENDVLLNGVVTKLGEQKSELKLKLTQRE